MENKKRDITLDQENYKQYLIKMFESAMGRDFHRESIIDIQNMVYYYAKLETIKKYYRSLLGTLRVDYNDEKCVEVGAGPVDSVLKDTSSTIVTPYYGLFHNREGKTYEGNFVVNHGDIEMVDSPKRKFEVETTPLEIGLGRVYITHNILDPYSMKSLLKLSRKNQVVIGAYGVSSDKNREKKLKRLREFAEKLEECSYNSCIQDNCYCDIVQGRTKNK